MLDDENNLGELVKHRQFACFTQSLRFYGPVNNDAVTSSWPPNGQKNQTRKDVLDKCKAR